MCATNSPTSACLVVLQKRTQPLPPHDTRLAAPAGLPLRVSRKASFTTAYPYSFCSHAATPHAIIHDSQHVFSQSFRVEGRENRQISLFIDNTVGRFFTGTFQGGKTARDSCYHVTVSIRFKQNFCYTD